MMRSSIFTCLFVATSSGHDMPSMMESCESGHFALILCHALDPATSSWRSIKLWGPHAGTSSC